MHFSQNNLFQKLFQFEIFHLKLCIIILIFFLKKNFININLFLIKFYIIFPININNIIELFF